MIFSGHGMMAKLMRQHDWARTPVGPVDRWPASLRAAVSICLSSRYPMLIWWGPELVMLYNDAYRPILGATKHPGALGQRGRECWPEIWHIIGPMLEGVLATGEATWSDDQLLLLDRNGYLEECYFTFSYSPVRDERGISGVFTAVTETTERVTGERRLRTLGDLGARAAEAHVDEEACHVAAQMLAQNTADVPFALIYLLDDSGSKARLVAWTGLEPGDRAAPWRADLSRPDGGNAVWPLYDVRQSRRMMVIDDLEAKLGLLPGGPWPESPRTALVLPIAAPGQEQLTGLMVIGLSPYRANNEEYRSFLKLIVGEVAAAINNARAYAAERQRAESLAELDRAKTIFFSNVSHEFRTPLTLLLGPLEELLRQPALTLAPEQREQLVIAHRNGLRLLRLVNTLLDFSRIEAGRGRASYVPVDLCTLTTELSSVFRSAIEKAGLRLSVACEPLTATFYVDPEMWEKIVLNLLSNAFKFTFTGEISVTLRESGEQAELIVRDTGVGIPAEDLPRLFERFHRVRGVRARTQEGSGIGLALVQELVRLHGGTIQVSSQQGVGTSFTVTIPSGTAHLPPDRIQAERDFASTALGAAPFIEEALQWLPEDGRRKSEDGIRNSEFGSRKSEAESEMADDGRRQMADGSETAASLSAEFRLPNSEFRIPNSEFHLPRILLADDNADMRRYIERLLGQRYQVAAVPDGLAALAAARAALPDLVLCDVMMPGLDGFELLRELRADERTREVPVIMLSARAGAEARIEGLESGAEDYLVKPFAARELLARVSAHLELSRLRHEASARQLDYTRRLQMVAQAALTINAVQAAEDVPMPEDVLQIITAQAREIIGAHQALASLTVDHNWSQAVTAVSFSEKYAAWREPATWPTETGLSALVCQTNQPVRLSSRELMAHPAWREVATAETGPSLRGWLAAPLTGNDGRNIGLIQLSERETGEFTAEDEAILVQLAQLASVAIENARLWHEVQEASRMKDEFLTVVSHELRTPLNAMLGWTQIVLRQFSGSAEQAHALEIIERSARAQQQLIEDLLDTARITTGKLRIEMQPVDLVAITERALDTVRPTAAAREIELLLQVADNLPSVSGDAARLQQVVWNLLSNALKFTPAGGRVEISIAPQDAAVRLTVSDTGQGIKPEFLPFVFDRFRQADSSSSRRKGGLGLGLALVKHLIELHGGTVEAASPGEGQGASFTLLLPRQAARKSLSAVSITQAQARESGSYQRVPSLSGLHILLVDDEAAARQMMQTILMRGGARVSVAASAAAALSMLFESPEDERPDVLVSDIGLPDEDGYALIHQVRAREPVGRRLPAVALTADARVEDRLRALEAGFQMHVPKPVEPEELIVVIASVAGRTTGKMAEEFGSRNSEFGIRKLKAR